MKGTMDKVDVVDVLISARKLIEDPTNWWDGGGDAAPRGTECALTALNKATPGLTSASKSVTRVLADAMNVSSLGIARFNDSHSHAEVLAAFDRAIATEQAGVSA